MSRIGKKPIPVPKAVKIGIEGGNVTITGPKGTLARGIRPEVEISIDGNTILVRGKDSSKVTDAYCGMTRSLINNMVTGVEKGFERKLMIDGVGYRAEVANQVLTLNVGFSIPVKFSLPSGINASVDKSNTVTLSCIDKELLGLTAARIRSIRKPEPYKGKGIRFEDEHIVRKVGKSAGKK